MREETISHQRIILFDGICNLCNASVQFVLKHEQTPDFHFASIQSEAGARLLDWRGLPPNYNEAVVYIENGIAHLGSTAALMIGRKLRFPWNGLAQIGLWAPLLLRDWVYRFIARNRYQWFGKQTVCMVPTDGLKARFL